MTLSLGIGREFRGGGGITFSRKIGAGDGLFAWEESVGPRIPSQTITGASFI